MNRKVTANLLFAAVILAVIVVVIIVGLLKTDPEEIIQGETEATSYRVSSKVPGRVAEIRFEEGDLVKKGDTLASLAKHFYDDESYVDDIVAANPGMKKDGKLKIGSIITLPATRK